MRDVSLVVPCGGIFGMLNARGAGKRITPRETVWWVAQVLPLTHAASLLRGLWTGERGAKHFNEVGILAVTLLLGMLILAKAFLWE